MGIPTYLVEFDELLGCATNLGYDWNQAHVILVADGIPPIYEAPSRSISMRGLDDYGWSKDTKCMLKEFMERNNVTEFTLIR